MGPTCIVPRSQYWAVDRDTFPHFAMRLDEACIPPKSLSEWHASLMEWSGFALSLHGKVDPETGLQPSGYLPIEARDERITKGLQLLGDPAAVDKPVVVPGGSVLIMHPDIFHRVSRSGHDGLANHDVPVRFMMGGGFSRGSEPTCSNIESGRGTRGTRGTEEEEAFAVDKSAQIVWEANSEFIRGGRDASWGSDASCPSFREAAAFADSDSDRERTSNAYRLGWMCKTMQPEHNTARNHGADALETLTVALAPGSSEAVQRAAMFGLSVGGQPAALRLVTLITEQLERTIGGQPLETNPLQVSPGEYSL